MRAGRYRKLGESQANEMLDWRVGCGDCQRQNSGFKCGIGFFRQTCR